MLSYELRGTRVHAVATAEIAMLLLSFFWSIDLRVSLNDTHVTPKPTQNISINHTIQSTICWIVFDQIDGIWMALDSPLFLDCDINVVQYKLRYECGICRS
jgi:hypothetical protein